MSGSYEITNYLSFSIITIMIWLLKYTQIEIRNVIQSHHFSFSSISAEGHCGEHQLFL